MCIYMHMSMYTFMSKDICARRLSDQEEEFGIVYRANKPVISNSKKIIGTQLIKTQFGNPPPTTLKGEKTLKLRP